MLLQGIILFTLWSVAAVINADPSDELKPQTFLYLAGGIACTGSIIFPIGLCSIFVWSSRLLETHAALFMIAGWITYLSVVIIGMIKPRKMIFLALLILLILNIGGCWLPHTQNSINLGWGD